MNPSMCRQYHRNLRLGAFVSFYFSCLMYSAQVWAGAMKMKFYDIPIPVLNVPATVLASAFAGTLCGLAYTPAVENRKQLYMVVVVNSIISSWAVVLLPEWRGWVISPVAQPPFAGVLATTLVFVIPAIFKRLPGAAGKFADRFLDYVFSRGTPPTGGQ